MPSQKRNDIAKGSGTMNIAIGADHAGFTLKESLKNLLLSLGHHVDDFGTDSAERSVDYPDIAIPVAEAVANGTYDRGILLCGTGIGMSIAANKVKGAYTALCHGVFEAQASRKHNNANILALGGTNSRRRNRMPDRYNLAFHFFEGGGICGERGRFNTTRGNTPNIRSGS
jgi:RpiB/LacA/LacB family sugar-phosphate isomerase